MKTPAKKPSTKVKEETKVSDIQERIVEVIKEVVVQVPEPRLEGFELYKKLAEKGFYQGGMGQWMEDVNGTERVYIPHPTEVITYFIGDPDKWDLMRDAIIRAYIELA